MTDVFISLNAIRVLSIIAMILVFSSNIVTLSNDIKAVNRFMDMGKRAGGTTALNATAETGVYMDYIMYVFICFTPRTNPDLLCLTGEALCRTNPRARSGRF